MRTMGGPLAAKARCPSCMATTIAALVSAWRFMAADHATLREPAQMIERGRTNEGTSYKAVLFRTGSLQHVVAAQSMVDERLNGRSLQRRQV